MEQNYVREQCIAYIEKHGSRQTFFSKKLGISKTHFYLWLQDERNFSDSRIEALKEILKG